MHKTIKRFIAVSVVLIVIGGVGSLLTVNSVVQSESVADTTKMDAKDITDVKVEASSQKITVKKADDSHESKVKWTGDDKDRLSVSANNGQLAVEITSKPFYLFSLGSDLKDFFDERELIVSLPEQTYNTVKLTNDSGKITLSELEANDIEVNNTNGKIDLNDLTANDVNVDMTNGKVAMENIDGNVTGRNVNGEIVLSTPDLDRDINLSTTNGRIIVQTKKRPTNALLDAHTSVGSVSLFDGHDRKIVYGDGDHHIELTTTTGLIKVEDKQ